MKRLLGLMVLVGATAVASVPPDCPYCTYFNPKTRMQSWVVNVSGCELGWTPALDKQGTPCLTQETPTPTPTRTPVRTPTGTPVAGPSPTSTRTFTPVATPTPTPGPERLRMSLPARGLVLELYCAPGTCEGDFSKPTWRLKGPWVVVLREE